MKQASQLLDFSGKSVLVTGAAAGIGRACAAAFAEAGAGVTLCDIDGARCADAATEIAANTGAQTLALACDVSDEEACGRLINDAHDRFGRLDVLINNAGVIATGGILDLSLADYDRVQSVNIRACFVLTQLAARRMVEAKTKGAIINMSSLNANLAIPDQVAYVTSKGALQQFTKAAALGLAEHGVRVNAFGPGSILPDIQKTVMH
ncbi:MAG: SDR family oxidoreductase, partial [Pseudomonadota bacterium]